MTSLKKTLKNNFKTRKRRALSGALIAVMLIVVAVAAIAVVSGQFFDLADTASIVDSIELTSPALYASQGYATIQVKNNGNTAINDIHASVLVAAAPAGGECATNGAYTATIGDASDKIDAAVNLPDLAPGKSITIDGNALVDVDGVYDGSTTAIVKCNTFKDRAEYIFRITGKSNDSTDYDLVKSVTVRAR